MVGEFVKLYKIVTAILKPIEQSTILLERIDAKLDAQATSKLKGQFRTVQILHKSGTLDKSALFNCLSSLNESCEYFKAMVSQSARVMVKTSFKKQLYGAFRDGLTMRILFKGLKESENKLRQHVEFQTYYNLVLLSKIGIVVCMHLLGDSLKSITDVYSVKNEDVFGDTPLFKHSDGALTLMTFEMYDDAICRVIDHEGLIPDAPKPSPFWNYGFSWSDNLGYWYDNFLLGTSRTKNREMIENLARARGLTFRILSIFIRHPIDQEGNNFDIDALINDIIDSKNLFTV